MANAVAIRIGTTGKNEVKNDFSEIKTAGTGAMQSIADGARKAGDIGEQQAARLAANYERATDDMLAADRRRAAAAQKLAAVTPQSSVQQVIAVNTGTGFNDNAKSARESAIIMAQLIDEQERYTARVNQFRAAIDPAFAAQQRFDREMAEARTLISTGGISLDEYVAKLRIEREALAQSSAGQEQHAKSSGLAKAGLQQLNFQLSDIATQYASGAKPMQIFAQQSGQLFQALGMIAEGGALAGKGAQAVATRAEEAGVDVEGLGDKAVSVAEKAEGLGGKLGAVASFMTGPWGAAVLVGVSVLTPFVAKLFESNNALDDAVDKLKKDAAEAEINRQAKERFLRTEESVAAAIRDGTDATNKSIEASRTAAEQANIAAKRNLEEEISIRRKTQARLEDAKALLAAQLDRATGPGGEKSELATGSMVRAQGQVDVLQGRIDAQSQLIIEAEKRVQVTRVDLAIETAKRMADPVGRINKLYDDQVAAAKRAAIGVAQAGGTVTTALTAQVEAIEAKRKKALAEEQASSRSSGGSAQANLGDMVALVKQLFPGARITSTNGGKHTSGSDHYADRAIDFVPAGGMSRYTTDEVESILRGAGVDIRRGRGGKEQMFGPGRSASKPGDHDDHFHFAWQGSASPEAAERRRAAAAEKAERDRDQAARRAAALAGMSADLDAAILEAKRAAITDGAQLAQFAKGQIDAEGDKYLASLAAKVETQDLTKAQAEELAMKRVHLDRLKDWQIDTDEAARRAADALMLQSAANDNERDLLNGQLSLATTTRDRLPLALRLLDLDKEEEQLRLRAIIDREALGKATAAEAEAARIRLGQLDQIYGARAQAAARENESPMQAYLREISTTGDQMNQQLESIGVNGLRSFTEELSDAIVNFKSLGDVAKHVLAEIAADLIKLQLRKGIAGLVTGVLGAIGGGAKLSAVNYGAIADAANSVSPTILGHASGTEYFSGGTALVGEQGRELVDLPAGSKIHNASATRRMLANDNRPSFHMPITIDARGADAAGLARVQAQLAQMQREIPERAIAAVQEYRERNHLDRGRAA